MTRYRALPHDGRPNAICAAYSAWARDALRADPTLAAIAAAGLPSRETIAARLAQLRLDSVSGVAAEVAHAQAMRVLKREVLLAAMHADLSGAATLVDVCAAMTDLAEICLQSTCDLHYAALAKIHGTPMAQGSAQPFLVIGMGKLGGYELNVSSDIDLIYAYLEDGETAGPRRIENHDFFVRLARKVTASMAEIDANGYVFRVDLRLRPNGDSGAMVSSLAALETYFVVQGREWERYAWIKARVVACTGVDQARRASAIDEIESLRRPFVYRKYLDFGAIAAIRDLHARIRAEAMRRAAAHPSRAIDIKLGAGGIREIEFFAQVFQLIRGGRSQRLQVRPTCEALRRLADDGWIAGDTSAALIADYDFLRSLEHRLQYVDDAQTHTVPPEGPEREAIARMMGLADGATLMQALGAVQARVEHAFENVIDDPTQAPAAQCAWFGEALRDEAGIEAARSAIAALAIEPADRVADRFAALVRGRRWQALPEISRTRLAALVEPALALAASKPESATVAIRFVDLFDAIAQRSAYLALLVEFPSALQRVGAVLAASPWAADYLTRHPILLDELLDERELRAPPDWPAVRAELHTALCDAVLQSGAPDVERRIDILRETHHVWTFRLLAQDLDGALTVEALADRLSALADIVLDEAVAQCWQTLANRHRDEPRFAVIAYGKLGGKELGYASDLDLVFVYDDDDERAPVVYAKLAQRLLTWLTTHTAAGRLFDVDMRLRPNGNAGLLVTSLAAFEKYQLLRTSNAAWIWEHQALTRARYCAGDAATGARFEIVRCAVLALERDRETVLAEIPAMRTRIHEGHPNTSGLFDLKHDAGGMIDIEFIVQALVLLHAARYSELSDNKGNIALLLRASERGLLPKPLAAACADAYRNYRARQHAIRLQAEGEPGPTRVDSQDFKSERDAVNAAWRFVFGPRE